MATSSYHVILFIIFQQHFTKPTFTYYFILTNFSIYQITFIYCKTLYWWEAHLLVLPAVIQLQFQILLINFSSFGSIKIRIASLSYKLKKAYEIKPV